MIYKPLIFRFFCVAILASLSFMGNAQDLAAGEKLFKAQCNTCHNRNMVDDLTGPALKGFEERWADYPEEDLYNWIRNSQKMIAEGHPRGVELWNAWKPTVMTSFNLSDEEIANVFAYINGVSDGTYGAPTVAAASDDAGGAEESDNTLLYTILFGILAILAVVLARIVSNLNYMSKVQDGNAPAQRRSLVDILTSSSVVSFVIFAIVVVGGFMTVNSAINLGRQQGYAPEQPIAFSHELHAGVNKIDCQYCHDGARRSKHSVIPAASTCMNCHKAIVKGPTTGTAEITKIYASIGFNPNDGTYIEGYEDYTEEQIEKVYKKWIGDAYVKENSQLDAEGERVIEEQWKGIKTSLTNPTKDKIQGPIEWVRIHNLPDHVYFNHSQHVSVGKVECQTCHGPVEKMETVQQYTPLSMGWCVNCHRQTEVKFADNPYYESYTKYHEELKNGERDKVTVEDIGGLECQKCHY